MNKDPQQNEQAENDEILRELKSAYKAINSLNKTASHRKIGMDIERKLRFMKRELKSPVHKS